MHFGVNHIGLFLLTNLLLPLLSTSSENPRIVNLTSAGHRLSPIRFSDPNFKKLTKELPEEEKPATGLKAPIWVEDERNLSPEDQEMIRKTAPVWKNLEEGAATAMVAAFDPLFDRTCPFSPSYSPSPIYLPLPPSTSNHSTLKITTDYEYNECTSVSAPVNPKEGAKPEDPGVAQASDAYISVQSLVQGTKSGGSKKQIPTTKSQLIDTLFQLYRKSNTVFLKFIHSGMRLITRGALQLVWYH
ncbi:hypothetical protein G7Y89_g7432 [Cudoniella acicularis]|uniref:Uncharacterized protein n=1 Tax=Cudoniella acicularis TaxID=354080 RepID=A0A8H4RIJ8_9HELO|nr:hypothetical protein G7Y89_g7432 [Cudoniella acicularis]